MNGSTIIFNLEREREREKKNKNTYQPQLGDITIINNWN
jgi:hypothetical protein